MQKHRPPSQATPIRQPAVALGAASDGEGPPGVHAKGRGKAAQQIHNSAFDHGTDMRGDADLTQVPAAIDNERVIPLEALVVVAEILNQAYRAKQRQAEELNP